MPSRFRRFERIATRRKRYRTVTAADKRYALADPLRWRRASGKAGTNSIVILPARKQQPVLGFGAALTDAAFI